MAKSKTQFFCKSCGHEEVRWLGQCPGCREWNTFTEVKLTPAAGNKGARGFKSPSANKGPVGFGNSGGSGLAAAWPEAIGPDGKLQPVPLAKVSSAETSRLKVEPEEVSRVMGGGLVEGSVVLLGGEPGVGKSTLLTGLALQWVRQGVRVIYVAGEESPAQIRMRAERLGFRPDTEDGFLILPEVLLENLLEALQTDRAAQMAAAGDAGSGKPAPCIIIADSIQTLHSGNIDAFPGSPTQIRYCGGVLADYARGTGCPVFLVGHVTKSGDLAGPKLLEHMVDTVLYFEGSGGGPIRMVRAVKNRFGTTGELAVMEMRGDGLRPVDQAGVLFLSGRRGNEPGSAVTAVKNGSRTFLVEVQALVSTSRYGTPQRVVQGVDSKRVALLAAILEKQAGMDLAGCDIFVKVAGGGRIDDPGADLAIIAALASSLRERPVPHDVLVLGEVGLTGEVRRVEDLEARVREASRHGFKRVILAEAATQTPAKPVRRYQGMQLNSVASVAEAVALVMQPAGRARKEEGS